MHIIIVSTITLVHCLYINVFYLICIFWSYFVCLWDACAYIFFIYLKKKSREHFTVKAEAGEHTKIVRFFLAFCSINFSLWENVHRELSQQVFLCCCCCSWLVFGTANVNITNAHALCLDCTDTIHILYRYIYIYMCARHMDAANWDKIQTWPVQSPRQKSLHSGLTPIAFLVFRFTINSNWVKKLNRPGTCYPRPGSTLTAG